VFPLLPPKTPPRPCKAVEEEEEEEEITSVQPKGHDEMTLSMRNNHIGKSKQNLTRAKST
jgi:hypothetical protein